MASSSQIACASPPSSDPCWKYDVFLSFRGADTRKGIIAAIHDRLDTGGIKTFMDKRNLQVGDVISAALLKAVEESRFAIIVLSKNYAFSTWCLEELRTICECMKDKNRILPLFYEVDPSDVRYQNNSFGDAFTMHENSRRHKPEKVEEWRYALKEVAGVSGWNTQDHETHKQLVDDIVKSICRKVVPDAIESTENARLIKEKERSKILKMLDDICETMILKILDDICETIGRGRTKSSRSRSKGKSRSKSRSRIRGSSSRSRGSNRGRSRSGSRGNSRSRIRGSNRSRSRGRSRSGSRSRSRKMGNNRGRSKSGSRSRIRGSSRSRIRGSSRSRSRGSSRGRSRSGSRSRSRKMGNNRGRSKSGRRSRIRGSSRSRSRGSKRA